MEIVLQWLDELDDLLLSVALQWEVLRRRCLQVGLLAAVLGLIAGPPAADLAPWTAGPALLAVLAVGVWVIGLAAGLIRTRPRELRSTA